MTNMAEKNKKSCNAALLTFLLGSCLMLVSPASTALTLGEVEVHSKLNQTLNVAIPLSASKEELASIKVTLAPIEVFSRFGIPRSTLLKSLAFEVINNNDAAHIKITTDRLIREPLLEFVLSVYWGNGKLLREFAIFLSP